MADTQLALSLPERTELESHEQVIERGLKTFYEVGTALAAIRDKRLYREAHGTFEEYCQERWSMSRPRAYQFIEAAGVVGNLSTIVDIAPPKNESQVRPLVELEPDEQKLVWKIVEETAPKGRITAAHVKSVVNVLKEVTTTGAIDSGEGLSVPVKEATLEHLKAAVTEETYERMKRQEQVIAEKIELKEQKRIERVENILRITEQNKDLNDGLGVFNLIYADPPWRYEHVATENRAIENHYPTMDLEGICNLPVAKLTADDCMLFMWATSPKLAESMRVLEAWGFNYRTCMVWVKDKIGMGYYARQRHELLLIAKKGNMPAPEVENRFDSIIEAPRGKHSEKPEEVYELIEAMYPEYRKIELFSRNARQGWLGWGNQYDDHSARFSDAA